MLLTTDSNLPSFKYDLKSVGLGMKEIIERETCYGASAIRVVAALLVTLDLLTGVADDKIVFLRKVRWHLFGRPASVLSEGQVHHPPTR
jgi:hypothetical protein